MSDPDAIEVLRKHPQWIRRTHSINFPLLAAGLNGALLTPERGAPLRCV